MARQIPEQARESRRLGGQHSVAGRPRYPKGDPRAGQLRPRGAPAVDPPPPPADPPPRPPAVPPSGSPRQRLNPLTATPRDVVDRLLGR